MISKADALSLVAYLVKAGYLSASEGQADVWADVLNDAAPYATGLHLREAARRISREPHRWVATGDVVVILHRIRSEEIEAEQRERIRGREAVVEVASPERIRQILAAHRVGGDPAPE